MPTRTTQLLEAVKPTLEAKQQETLENIQRDFDARRDDIILSFRRAFETGLRKVAAAGPAKGKIKRVHISYLLSSLLTGKCEFRVDFYNSGLYLDELETEFYWTADFITDYLRADFTYFQTLLKKTLFRVMDYEVRNMVLDFGVFYLSAFTFYWPEIVANLPLADHAELFEDAVEIVYGGFQDESVAIAAITVREELPCDIS